ncbi:MAG: hypothetical protein JHC87_06255 [Thermoleophilaceae bacterium]|nr:hypothetical protein [Thermoleophilaceae bacterium]
MIQLQTASALVVNDLFVVGLVLNLYALYLIASGLRLSDMQIAQRAASYSDYSHAEAVALARNKADGYFGVGYLLLGSGLQLLTYLITIGAGNDYQATSARAMVAFFLLLFTGLTAVLAHRSLRQVITRRIVVDIARCDFVSRDGQKSWATTNVPSRKVLLGCAQYLPADRHPGEPDEAFVRRVYNVKRTRTDYDEFDASPSAAAMRPDRRRSKVRT